MLAVSSDVPIVVTFTVSELQADEGRRAEMLEPAGISRIEAKKGYSSPFCDLDQRHSRVRVLRRGSVHRDA